tara:strand:- start:642 stop:857 length:216 start_codon:yes stop_codon:yes gene_type:complete
MITRKLIYDTETSALFEEKNDPTHVYIEVENVGDCSFELWTNGSETSSRALIKISKEDFEKMIDAYKPRKS